MSFCTGNQIDIYGDKFCSVNRELPYEKLSELKSLKQCLSLSKASVNIEIAFLNEYA